MSLNIFLKYFYLSRSALLLTVSENFTSTEVAFQAKKKHIKNKAKTFLLPTELAKISFCNKNVLGKNENLQTYWQNVFTIQKTGPEL